MYLPGTYPQSRSTPPGRPVALNPRGGVGAVWSTVEDLMEKSVLPSPSKAVALIWQYAPSGRDEEFQVYVPFQTRYPWSKASSCCCGFKSSPIEVQLAPPSREYSKAKRVITLLSYAEENNSVWDPILEPVPNHRSSNLGGRESTSANTGDDKPMAGCSPSTSISAATAASALRTLDMNGKRLKMDVARKMKVIDIAITLLNFGNVKHLPDLWKIQPF
jgi:hypothetical protein